MAKKSQNKSTSGPTQTNAARRAAGRRRISAWISSEADEKLTALCEESGFGVAEQIEALIHAEHDLSLIPGRVKKRS